VISIVQLADVVSYLETLPEMKQHLQSVQAYRAKYGIE